MSLPCIQTSNAVDRPVDRQRKVAVVLRSFVRPTWNVSTTLRQLFDRCQLVLAEYSGASPRTPGPAPEPPGFLQASLGCSKIVLMIVLQRPVKRRMALRGRNLPRDSPDRGCVKDVSSGAPGQFAAGTGHIKLGDLLADPWLLGHASPSAYISVRLAVIWRIWSRADSGASTSAWSP
jgi:hypothetical protein